MAMAWCQPPKHHETRCPWPSIPHPYPSPPRPSRRCSGGPVFVKGHGPEQDVLIGTVSFSDTLCAGGPSSDTNVAQLRQWIDQTMEQLVPFVPQDGARELRGARAAQGQGQKACCSYSLGVPRLVPTTLATRRKLHQLRLPLAVCPSSQALAAPAAAVYADSVGVGFDGKALTYAGRPGSHIDVRTSRAGRRQPGQGRRVGRQQTAPSRACSRAAWLATSWQAHWPARRALPSPIKQAAGLRHARPIADPVGSSRLLSEGCPCVRQRQGAQCLGRGERTPPCFPSAPGCTLAAGRCWAHRCKPALHMPRSPRLHPPAPAPALAVAHRLAWLHQPALGRRGDGGGGPPERADG